MKENTLLIEIKTLMTAQEEAIHLLQYIQQHPDTKLIKLREELGLSQLQATGLINLLKGGYLIREKQHPRDRRSIVYRITEYGEYVLQ